MNWKGFEKKELMSCLFVTSYIYN